MGTTRRQPRPASSFMAKPCSSIIVFAFGLVVEGADRLGRVGEGRVLGVDRDLREQGHDRHLQLALAQVVVQRLLEHVADLALAHGAADVHRHRRHESWRRPPAG